MTNATIDSAIRAHGAAALEGLRELPGSDNAQTREKLAEIMQQIVQMRDGLIGRQRAGENTDHFLIPTNAVISSLFGTEFPVSGFNKRRIDETRTALENLLGSIA